MRFAELKKTCLRWAPWIALFYAIFLQIRVALILLPADLLEPDPPAHFTTGVMVLDFLRKPSFQPLPFAQCFYVQYPKVGFGHWPPVFYILEAVWFLLFGAQVWTARILCAGIAGGCALALYRRCAESWEPWYAAACAAVFLAAPQVQQQAWTVMSDLLLALFVFLALARLSRFLVTGTWRESFGLAAWTCLAILTKGTAWLLLASIVIGPLVTRRTRLYFTWVFWATVLSICLVSAPFYVLMRALNLGYPTPLSGHIYRLRVISRGLTATHCVLGVLLLILVVALWRFWSRKELSSRTVMVAVMSLWIVFQVLSINIVPLTPQLDRYYIPSFLPLAFLIAGVMVTLDGWLASRGAQVGKVLAILAFSGALAASGGATVNATRAFSQALKEIPVIGGHRVILVESDSAGEGALIAARLQSDANRSSYVLRSSKLLSSSQWSGKDYSLKYHDSTEVRAALDNNFVEYIVLDKSAPAGLTAPQLETVLRDPASEWETVGRTPVAVGRRSGDLVIYKRQIAPNSAPTPPISIQLGPERRSQTVTCRAANPDRR